ncbi:MAG: acetylxylan esterase, partial [Candidatus Brockarchaeota archaeon]|nr:acetylxylan esterase [Candidatus Brockarchaeota archaeon]
IPRDGRFVEVRRLDMPLELKNYSKREWLKRKEEIKKRILFACGLLPEPRKTPLNAEIFGTMEREDYKVEKAFFESYPGFYVTGNLYRPLEGGKHPGVLCPHGHWSEGRLAGDVQARCANFARQGYVAFLYDMVGYNDSKQVDHAFGGASESLWGISLMGLQLWNSIRAIDFLQSLEDVDPERIGCTGESGGGTQTFMVSAVDERVKVCAPVCMVSAHFQGGCLCENAPSLRLDTNNVEIAALTAPRPMMLVSATGDWTRRNPWVEYPFIKRIYGFFGAAEKVECVQVNAPHNYNKESREAVYGWFAKWLLGKRCPGRIVEKPFVPDRKEDLLVFDGRGRPPGCLDAKGLRSYLVERSREAVEKLRPRSAENVRSFKSLAGEAMRLCLSVDPTPEAGAKIVKRALVKPKARLAKLLLGRRGSGEEIPGIWVRPFRRARKGALVVYEDGKSGLFEGGRLNAFASGLLSAGFDVLSIDCFLEGEYAAPVESRREVSSCYVNYYETYNRTDSALKIQDILTALSFLRRSCGKVSLAGFGEAGAWCLLASSVAGKLESVASDLNGFEDFSEESWLKRLYIPGIMKAGGLRAAAALNVPARLLVHNTGGFFDAEWVRDFYRILSAEERFESHEGALGHEAILGWVARGGGKGSA